MDIRLLRHATLVLDWGDISLLVDPMLSPAEAMDPIGNAGNDRRIPMVELPVSDDELQAIIDGVDGVLVTHVHRDHWDARAIELIPKDKPILTQPASLDAITTGGFTNVTAIEDTLEWQQLSLRRTGGHHGTGEIEKLMGVVSGFVLRHADAPTVYLAGDTIWCEEVADALAQHGPEITILNTGGAQFNTGDPITMTVVDVAQVSAALPATRIIADHMDTINHCHETREKLAGALEREGLRDRVLIPGDGERLSL
jgi:L-ascorbate metabolism protein UlaG (beta-lactamase superfamily)